MNWLDIYNFAHSIINDILTVIPTLTSGPASESVTSRGFTIRWGSCQHGENGFYRFENRKKDAGEWTTKNATSRFAVITGLLRNHEYYVRVSCYWKDSSGLFRLIPGVHEEILVKTLCTGIVFFYILYDDCLFIFIHLSLNLLNWNCV